MFAVVLSRTVVASIHRPIYNLSSVNNSKVATLGEQYDLAIMEAILSALKEMERNDEIILFGPTQRNAAVKIAISLKSVIPQPSLTPEEFYGVRALILHALESKSFFDWEMPTLTGLTEEKFREVARKLPH
ncbi:hypothetical protein GOZ78_09995 [Agrobacterium vitis]|uniref:Uncharacterized protein n=1 Tax=Agrobacterium vitis TaxID=373 RepID=A0A109CSG9_AGRVI|nr:hypothetical protein [Agrobacterium vitis]KAA3517691.1 hypothetical protein DXM22_08325 [Agrobacterium vitis]KAA3523755.1 hypothetical protein DXT89_20155 [Agrobacterium vitis]KAA3524122.1 hypothetical protein DXT89_19250 [Agrobacterium vitis]MCF1476868.1 hypothetical protein [Agrobacterium vitis]MUO78370.1 hypothetical protein [Agrobacterium vitis]